MEILLVAAATLIALGLAWLTRAAALAARASRNAAGRLGEARVSAVLDEHGAWDRLDDVVLGKGLRASAQIDHLVRAPRCLVVVESKNWSGLVTGGPGDAEWTLTRRNGRTTRHRNPLLQAAAQARKVVVASGEAALPVHPLVVMAGRAHHASGRFPDGVLLLREVPTRLPPLLDAEGLEEARVSAAWGRLVEDAFSPDASRRAARYVGWLEQRFGEKTWHVWLVVAFALAATAWSMSLYLHYLKVSEAPRVGSSREGDGLGGQAEPRLARLGVHPVEEAPPAAQHPLAVRP
jgi:hypothetical protein